MNAVDTNVLIYACDKTEPRKQKIAEEILRESAGGVLPWQVACEFIAAARKLEEQGFTRQRAWARLSELLEAFKLVLPSCGILEDAQVLHVEQQWSFWDAMIVAACLEAGVNRLYSEDIPGRSPPPGLEIVNPFA